MREELSKSPTHYGKANLRIAPTQKIKIGAVRYKKEYRAERMPSREHFV